MSEVPPYDPEATMAGFEARRPIVGTRVPPPDEPGGPARRTRPRRATPVVQAAPPFGSRRGNRVAYSLNLPRSLAERLDAHLHDSAVGRTSPGAIAVSAIRAHWRRLHDGTPAPEIFARETHDAQPRGSSHLVRKVFYISSAEADAIELVRLQLGGLDLRTLHIRALELLFEAEAGEPD